MPRKTKRAGRALPIQVAPAPLSTLPSPRRRISSRRRRRRSPQGLAPAAPGAFDPSRLAAARYNSPGRITPTSEPRMPDLRDLKGIADKDRKLIEDAEALLGPEPSTMGFVK